MKSTTRQLLAWAGIALGMGTIAAHGQSLRTLDAGGGLYLNQIGDRAAVREPSGSVSELSLPPGTALRCIEPLTGGWIAAGEIEVPGATDLFLLVDEGGRRRPFPAPANTGAVPVRAGPMPLVENGRLVGLAWLAGERLRRAAVWVARWSGLDWSPPELVSPVGPGTQIAIDGAVLADGSWLLAWTAFDGQDDEILWSRRAGGRWSEPAALHEPNEVPDITPALVATGSGALVAWNQWDGQTYRVRLAALAGEGWRELGLSSPAGAVSPGLTPHANGARLLYRTVRPSTWILHDLDARGAVTRTAAFEMETTTRPGLAPGERGAAAFEWPGEELATPVRAELEWRVEP